MAQNNLKVTYKGQDIIDADISQIVTKTLLTQGKYCEGDIVIAAQGVQSTDLIPMKGRTFQVDGFGDYASIILRVPGNHTYTVKVGPLVFGDVMYVYDSETFENIDFWRQTADPRTYNFSYGSGEVIVGLNLNLAEIDDCYFRDDTTGEYIWKGANVTD